MKNELLGIEPDCYGCLVNQSCSTARHAGLDRQQTQDVLDATFSYISMARQTPMVVQHIVRKVANKVQSILGKENVDLYAEVKRRSHEVALSFLQGFQKEVLASASPIEMGIRIAAAGNIIDFGAKEHANLDIKVELSNVQNLQFGRYDWNAFQKRLSTAKSLLYVCDNVGEIVFDKILMEQLKLNYPELQITAAMRESPIINDATVDDAHVAGLEQVATVISSGSVYPGTILEECNTQFKELFSSADLVISKGQGNFETLLADGDERVFFLLRIKCDTMAKLAGQKKGDLVFICQPRISQLNLTETQ